MSLLAAGHSEKPAPALLPTPRLDLQTVPIAKHEVDYPAMRAIHETSSLVTPKEVIAWRDAVVTALSGPAAKTGQFIPIEPLSDLQAPSDPIEEVVLRRGSSRRFSGEPISFTELSTILDRSTRGIPADFPPMNEIYLIVNGVDGLREGSYFFNSIERRLEVLRFGDFRAQAAYLALEQRLAGDAAVAVFFLADLERVFGYLGNRGYRAVQLEAGLLGGKMYLAAYALRLGATGLTFYDDEVTQFFSPHAGGKSAIFLTALGRPAKRTLA